MGVSSMADPLNLVTLEEAQAAVNTTNDISAEITRASKIIRELIGPVIHESVTEYQDGGFPLLFLRNLPVVEGSVTVIDRKSNDTVVTNFTLLPDEGALEHNSVWPSGFRRFKVQYTAGWAPDVSAVPQPIKEAAFILIRDMITGGSGAAEGIKRESIGDYTVEYFGEAQVQVSRDALDRAMKYLEPYRMVRIG